MDAAHIPFTEWDERAIRGAARWGTIVACTTIATALLTGALSTWTNLLVGFELVDVLDGLLPAVEIVLSIFLLAASRRFRLVATTDEADQAHLLAGFRSLRVYVAGQVLTIAVGFVMSLIAAVWMWSWF